MHHTDGTPEIPLLRSLVLPRLRVHGCRDLPGPAVLGSLTLCLLSHCQLGELAVGAAREKGQRVPEIVP